MTDLQSPQNTFLTVADVAVRYKVSRTTLDRWRAAGSMPAAQRINGRPRWRLSVLEAWENDQGEGDSRHG